MIYAILALAFACMALLAVRQYQVDTEITMLRTAAMHARLDIDCIEAEIKAARAIANRKAGATPAVVTAAKKNVRKKPGVIASNVKVS